MKMLHILVRRSTATFLRTLRWMPSGPDDLFNLSVSEIPPFLNLCLACLVRSAFSASGICPTSLPVKTDGNNSFNCNLSVPLYLPFHPHPRCPAPSLASFLLLMRTLNIPLKVASSNLLKNLSWPPVCLCIFCQCLCSF